MGVDHAFWESKNAPSGVCAKLLWTVAFQALLTMGFSRQEYWSGLPCPLPGYLPDPEIEPVCPAALALQADSLLPSHWGSPQMHHSVQFSCSVISDSLRPYGLQRFRPPCPSPTPRVYSSSFMSIELVMPSSHLILFSSSLQSFPASGSVQMSQFFASDEP